MGHGWCSCVRLPPPGPFFKQTNYVQTLYSAKETQRGLMENHSEVFKEFWFMTLVLLLVWGINSGSGGSYVSSRKRTMLFFPRAFGEFRSAWPWPSGIDTACYSCLFMTEILVGSVAVTSWNSSQRWQLIHKLNWNHSTIQFSFPTFSAAKS